MELRTEKQRIKFVAELTDQIEAPGTEIELELHGYGKSRPLHDILSRWNNSRGRNFLKLAILHNKEKAVYDILDILCLGATHYGFWTKEKFVEFLCQTDNDGNNVLQLALLHKSYKKRDLLPKTLLKYAAAYNERKLAKLVDNLNNDRQSSVYLAITKYWDEDIINDLIIKSNWNRDIISSSLNINNRVKILLEASKAYNEKSKLRAIIIYNDEEDNKTNARSLDKALRGRGFYVNHWQHVEWDEDNLLPKLEQFCKEHNTTEQLWVLCLTHGEYGYIFDPSDGEIKINDIVQKITKASSDETEVTAFHI